MNIIYTNNSSEILNEYNYNEKISESKEFSEILNEYKYNEKIIESHTPITVPIATPVTTVIVVCLDNTGYEDCFDVGIEYVGEVHDDVSMFWVYDRFGNRKELLKDRFEIKGKQ